MVWQTVGHDSAVLTLSRALEQDRMHHALLVMGPSRVGKKALAFDIARALDCVETTRPCGACRACERISSSLHPDVRVIGLEEDAQGRRRTLISIDQIREIQKEASLRPYEGAFRVFIVDGVDKISDEAANSLLKTLEEPPEYVVLVLLASNANDVLPTIVSRCHGLELRPVGVDVVAGHLSNYLGVENERSQEIAKLSSGRIGWAIQAAQDPELLERLSERLDVIDHIIESGLEQRFEYAAQLSVRFVQGRDDVFDELGIWLGWWRDIMVICQCKPEMIRHTSRKDFLETVANRLDFSQCAMAVKVVERAMDLLERNVNPRLAFEEMMLSMPCPQVTQR